MERALLLEEMKIHNGVRSGAVWFIDEDGSLSDCHDVAGDVWK